MKRITRITVLLIAVFVLIGTASCARTPIKGDAGKEYTLNITAICSSAPGCTITHTTKIEIKADVKKDQRADAEATQTTTLELKATGI